MITTLLKALPPQERVNLPRNFLLKTEMKCLKYHVKMTRKCLPGQRSRGRQGGRLRQIYEVFAKQKLQTQKRQGGRFWAAQGIEAE
jgi:hypothetical protein